MIEPGKYRAQAIDAGLGFTDTGKEQVVIEFKLLDMDYPPVVWYGFFTEATETRTLESLRIAGWTRDDVTDLEELCGPDTPEVELVIQHETDQRGNVRAKVRWINRLGSGTKLKNPMTEEQRTAFSERMNARIQAFNETHERLPF